MTILSRDSRNLRSDLNSEPPEHKASSVQSPMRLEKGEVDRNHYPLQPDANKFEALLGEMSLIL